MPNGVKLLLEHGAHVPWWISMNKNVTVRREDIAGKKIRCILIRGGKAEFIPGESVSIVHLPGYRDLNRVMFSPKKVLEIRDLHDNLIKRNHHCCPKCYAMTGEVQAVLPSKVHGRQDATIRCSSCGSTWEVLL